MSAAFSCGLRESPVIFAASSLYAGSYFAVEAERSQFALAAARRFGALWLGALTAMMAVLVCGNLGLMWVGIEATTLLTAFLIRIHVQPLALEDAEVRDLVAFLESLTGTPLDPALTQPPASPVASSMHRRSESS